MKGGVSKAWTRRSPVKLSKALQQTLLNALASNIAGNVTLQAWKRRLDAGDPRPAKRSRLTQADTQQPIVEDDTAEQPKKPTPRPPKRPYSAFLEEAVDGVDLVCSASTNTFVSEWLQSLGSDREKFCRSDSCLYYSEEADAVSRQLTRSAPEMSYIKDADGFAVPSRPVSAGSRSRRPSSVDNRSQSSATPASGASTPSAVRHRMYRQNNLALNNIFTRPYPTPLPDVISSHVEVVRAERSSPGPSPDEMKSVVYQLGVLAEGCDEDDVATFLNNTVFPNTKADPAYGLTTGLMSSSGAPMSVHLVPTNPICPYKVSQPKPDKLYGYSGMPNTAFTQQQLLAQATLHPQIPHYPAATSLGLRFPFLAIEFKAAGGSGGDLWVATNQCAGASSACLNAIHQLNASLPNYPSVQRVDDLSYSIAVDNNTAQLYISWKDNDLTYLQRVDAFLLSSPDHFKNFRKQVRNILDWGMGTRLDQIRNALDLIVDENRGAYSQVDVPVSTRI